MKQKRMPGRLYNLKRRKCSSGTRGSIKCSVKKEVKKTRPELAHPKSEMSHNESSLDACSRQEHSTLMLPDISCDCQDREKHPSCGAAPNPGESEGKENCLGPEQNHCRMNSLSETMEGNNTEKYVDNDIFPDDNSNQILPVEQFFGNLEVVQDCPQRPAITSTWGKREHKRRRYYAKQDSDEEGCSDMQQDDSEGS
ncbi:UPF0688 protein C1orf174 homolog [Osmerus eperlanus]|uniref:UPF0688 protein C1orf174 homolog n=1 Tax=Osmerus eperlanus TaxID=29151 RepID=UPI002E0D9CCC